MASTSRDHMLFATLGPEASNHALVLRRYLEARGLRQAHMRLFDDFAAAFDALLSGAVDYVLQVSAHPAHGDCVGRTMGRAFIVDTFIAESRPLALLTRMDVEVSRSIGLQPATRHYTDLSAWRQQMEEPTIVAVAEGLLAGRYDSGIAALDTTEHHPGRLRAERILGAALDAWILFGRTRLDNGFVLWPDAPVRQLFERSHHEDDRGADDDQADTEKDPQIADHAE